MNTVVFDYSEVIHIRPPNNAYCMDCMEAMKQMQDKAFELAIVDPPYGIGETAKRALTRARATSKWNNAKPVIYVGNDEWDNEPPPKEYFDELFRVSANQIIWGANYYPQYLTRSMGWIAWYKKGQNPNSDFSDCEFAYTSFWRASKLFDFPWVGFGAVNAKEIRIHPTQKPVALYEWLLRNYAKPGDKILDTHLGSGSSRIAAYNMGFEFVGYEIDPYYFAAQEERFQAHISQVRFSDLKEEEQPEQIGLFEEVT